MNLEQLRARNDALRQTFKGGRILMTLSVWSLPAQLRGQALWHMSRYQAFHQDSDHGDGLFIHCGVVFRWYIGQFAGGLCLTLELGDEMLE